MFFDMPLFFISLHLLTGDSTNIKLVTVNVSLLITGSTNGLLVL